MYLLLIRLCTCHYSLLLYTSFVICIWCLARSLDLTHLWCLGSDHDPARDAIYKAPVVGDYEWGPADQVVEPVDGKPTQGDWVQLFLFGILRDFVVSWVDWQICINTLIFTLEIYIRLPHCYIWHIYMILLLPLSFLTLLQFNCWLCHCLKSFKNLISL